VRLPDPQRSRVVLIGTSEYRDENLPDLLQVGIGVKDLATILCDPVDGIVSPPHCEVIADEENLPLIGRKLRAAAREAEDLLLVYFSGHGLVGGKRHDLYLGLHDSEWADPEFNSLEYDKLRSAVLDSPAATKVIILDCCFSGRAITEAQAGPAELLGQIEVDGSYVLTAAHRDQVALIVPGEAHTAFTGRLLRLLREGVEGGPELLTIEDLYRELRVRMKSEGLSVPQKRGTDTAELLALAHNRMFAATMIPKLRERTSAAVVIGESGKWDEAAKRLRGILTDLERIAGPEHEDTLRVRQLIAHAVGGAGDPLEAAAMLETLLPEQTRILGPDHEITLTSRQYLAVNLGEAGHRDRAVAILRVLLPDRRRVLGNDDPHTLRTAHMLARNLSVTDEPGEAIALLRELVAARERVLGPDHPHTARSRRDLTTLLKPTS
jgi:caspase domain-containing protein/tetratricopeptide repeat protein